MLPSFLINFHKFFRFINSFNSFKSRYIWNQIQHFYAICNEIKAKQVNPISGIVLPFGGSFASPFITPSSPLPHPPLISHTVRPDYLSNHRIYSHDLISRYIWNQIPRVGIIWSSQTLYLHLPPQSIHHFHPPPQSLHHLHHPPPTPFLHLR